MADGDDGIGFPPNSCLSPPPPTSAIPLQLCGFQSGDTVQVRGDTGELQFSVQFNLRREDRRSDNDFSILEADVPEIVNLRDSVQSSPYLTPTSSSGQFDNHINNADENSGFDEAPSPGGVMTRLRSGALSPVKYYHGGIYGVPGGTLKSGKKRKPKKVIRKGDNLFEEMLRRRSLPVRPCNSYAFFLMKNWGVVKRHSFAETSKRLSKQWSDLPHDVKMV